MDIRNHSVSLDVTGSIISCAKINIFTEMVSVKYRVDRSNSTSAPVEQSTSSDLIFHGLSDSNLDWSVLVESTDIG